MKRLSLVREQMKASIRLPHSTNGKLIKRLPEDYDLVRIALARIFHELLSRDNETGNPLAGLSGLSRRSFSEDGSTASAK
jgi:hypothetical protein